MKKLITLLLLVVITVSLTSCGEEKYPYEHLGIYDNNTKQYIDIGMPISNVEKILGDADKSTYHGDDGSEECDYADNLYIKYDSTGLVEYISVYFGIADSKLRYSLPNGTSYNSTVTDFIDSYSTTFEKEETYTKTVLAYVYKKNNKLFVADKKVITEMQSNAYDYETELYDKFTDTDYINDQMEKYLKEHPLYTISVDYSTYDDLDLISVERDNFYYYRSMDDLVETKQSTN